MEVSPEGIWRGAFGLVTEEVVDKKEQGDGAEEEECCGEDAGCGDAKKEGLTEPGVGGGVAEVVGGLTEFFACVVDAFTDHFEGSLGFFEG